MAEGWDSSEGAVTCPAERAAGRTKALIKKIRSAVVEAYAEVNCFDKG